ncbi:hypothetical protein JHK82_056601 [Glycine max]|uniref:Uncharacterized protein n=1 Tax=Glycine soja TaxID=3848 RepID=A0A445F633_GLYSO|nr:hypothetical protein JHK86_056434 [Glycine max]KAG4910582.1 hypothetical protein JHK87_056698 [Glycine soja]KAG4919160.1 hypothetical protein JHK85_057441 [Glycine max]KAG5075241.1 hypothetical protein JHK84_056472 [Glycine max]KAG5077906.1 hypothetical protein JHK82_056601 [Glycine max]
MTNSYRMSACGLPNAYSHILPAAELVVMMLPGENIYIYIYIYIYILVDKNSVNFYQNHLILWVLPACMNGATFFSELDCINECCIYL